MGQKPKVLVDTDILIKTFRGYKPYKVALDKLEGKLAVSIVSFYELALGVKTKRRLIDLNKQMRAYSIIHINEAISTKALELLQKNIIDHQIKLPDALIAATTLVKNYQLFTDNRKDFEFISGISFFEV